MLKINCNILLSRYFLCSSFNLTRGYTTVKFLKDFHLQSCTRNIIFNKRIVLKKHLLARNYAVDTKRNGKHFQLKKIILISGATVVIGAISLGIKDIIFRQPPETLKKVAENHEEIPRFKMPRSSDDIPKKIPYLLIGGGTASFSAFRAIKSRDPTAKVLVITEESYFPYMRPPLSKEMWFENDENVLTKLSFKLWNGTERSLFFEPEEFYIDIKKLGNEPKGGIAVARGWSVTKIDAQNKKVVLEDGTEIEYDKCLLATGSQPKNVLTSQKSFKEIQNKVTLFQNIDDFRRIYQTIIDGGKSLIIVGGNLLGTELACSLSKNGLSEIKVIQTYPEEGNLGKMLPKYLSTWTTEKIRAEGVEIYPNMDIQNASLSSDGKCIELTLVDNKNNGNTNKIYADHVIVAGDSVSSTNFADLSNLEIDRESGGFLVNKELLVHSDLYAAGDCASYYDPVLGRRKFEHHDHAVISGRLAGENMTGAGKSYLHQPMFWSELGSQISLEAVGIVDSSLPTVAVYAIPNDEVDYENTDKANKINANAVESEGHSDINVSIPKDGEDYNKGVLFYLRNDFIVGIVLWNVFNHATTARQILKEKKKFHDLNEVAKLFNIHSE